MISKNRKLNSALLSLVGVLVIAIGAWGGQAANGGVAQAAAPVAQSSGGKAAANAANVPNTTFSQPDLVSWIGEYDNYPGIAASEVDGHVSVDWGAAPSDDTGRIYLATNLGFNQQTDIQAIRDNDPGLINCKNQFGPCPIAIDGLNRTHFLYWDYSPGFCTHYVLANPGGAVVVDELIPGSCGGSPRKLLAIAVDAGLTVHVVEGRDNEYNTKYWERLNSGAWSVISETVTQPCGATGDLTLTVSTLGVVMAAYKDCGLSGAGSDIWTSTRTAANEWHIDDISASCCSNCPNSSKAYLPNLASAPDGGIRVVWADGRCPDNENAKPDIYYREWMPNVPAPGSGWDGQPIVRVAQNSGTSYHNALAVDGAGEAHIVWADDTSSPFAYYRTFYSHGRGTTFSAVEIPFNSWAPGSWQRDVAIDAAFGYIHVAFSTVRTDPKKDVYYSWAVAGPLVTPTPTNTPTATATPAPPCQGIAGDFQDVCVGSTFYDAVHYVFQQSIMTGYPCGGPGEPCEAPNNRPYFRVNNSTTRGQMAKVVVLGSGLTVITPTVSYFQDVPVGSTFFSYVETAAANQVIGGYPCGGAGEPCVAPDNKPYYRPNSSVTRGQLTKMVSTAFNFTEPVSGQTFEDVPPSATFYTYTQRLSSRAIINGYPCGGATEPCIPPVNRPYFRSGNPVTRGQTASIIYKSSVGQPSPTPMPTSTPVPPPSCDATVIIYGLASSGDLISFDAAAPGVLLSNNAITGLAVDESLVGIDFRPATGELYGLGNGSHLYTIDPSNGAATQVGASGAFTLTGTYFGFDFNPTVDRVRVVSDADQNLRLNPDTGGLAAEDGTLAYAVGDPNEGADPNVVEAAYTNSYSGAGSTSLYDIDSDLDILALQAPPNTGTLNTIGSLGVDVLSNSGFDIRDCNNDAYASFTPNTGADGASSSELYMINLTTGVATSMGVIGSGNISVDGLAVAPSGFVPPLPTATPTSTPTAAPTGTPFARPSK